MVKTTLNKIIGKSGLFVDGDWVESKDQDPAGDVRLIQLADIGDGNFIDKSKRFLTSGRAKELRCTYLQKGDVLVARMPDPVGRACIFPGSDMPCVTVVDICIIRPDYELVNPLWLKFLVNSPEFRNEISRFITGTTRQRISRNNLTKIPFLLPLLSEQNQTATNLSKAESLIAQRKESIRLLDEFLKSTFLEMFGDPVRNEKGWESSKLGHVINIKHGFAFSSEYFAAKGEYVLLTPGNYYEEGGYRDRGEKQKYYIGEIPKDYLLKKGDLLVAMTEQAAGLLGSAIIVPESDKFLHNQRLGLVEFDSNKCNTQFLFFLFNFDSIRFLIHAKATGIKVRHTSPGRIQEIFIGIPPLEVQIQFAYIVEKTELIKTQYKQSLEELEKLYCCLSQKSFNGELRKMEGCVSLLPQKFNPINKLGVHAKSL